MPDFQADADNDIDREPLVQYEDLEQATGFTQVSNAVLRCYPELSDGEKMTYAVLKSFAYVGPETFVGQETLARARGITVSTISRHLTRLIEVGLVKVRRRGQGKTNIWIITRIPRKKLEQYINDWRPKLSAKPQSENPQTQTSQNPQVSNLQNPQTKNRQDPQAEEQERLEDEDKPQGRSSRPLNGSSSMGDNLSPAALTAEDTPPDSVLEGVVENWDGIKGKLSTSGETVENLAAIAAECFAVPEEEPNIAGYLRQYDKEIVKSALATVVQRLNRGQSIRNPVAYFYTVVRVAQAENDAAQADEKRDENEKQVIACNWARSLLREWPADQVRAILMDTYHSDEFVDTVMDQLD